MKYLIPVSILFFIVVSGCEGYSGVRLESTEEMITSGRVTSGKTLAYLNKPLKGKVVRPGLYRLVRSGGIINDPSTSTGKSVAKPVVELIRSTDRIPLIKSAQMYLQYRIWPLPERPAYPDLRRVLKHPEMTLPDGRVTTGSDFMIKGRNSANQVIGYTGYGLDEDYELVEGEWTFEIWYKDRKMIEQTFITYWPDEEEVAALEPLLALGNRVMGQTQSTDKKVSKRDWPRITIGGTTSSDAAESSK